MNIEDILQSETTDTPETPSQPINESPEQPLEEQIPSVEGRQNTATPPVDPQTDEYRRLLEEFDHRNRIMAKQAEDAAFAQKVQSRFGTDPVGATELMIRRAQSEILDAVNSRILQAVESERTLRRFMEDFFTEPANAGLQPFRDELTYLIRDKGMHPAEAAHFMKSIDNRIRDLNTRRNESLKELKRRTATEIDDISADPIDSDRELNRVLKTTKSLDEMFSALKKLNA